MKTIYNLFFGGLLCSVFSITSANATTYYVSPSGNDGNNGTSWALAKKTIQAGINAASANDTVLVADGTYVLTSQIVITNEITVKSVNGAGVTIVDGGYPATTNRCFFMQQTVWGWTNGIIDGFTIRNGHVSDNGGGIRVEYGGNVRNCIIVDNYAGSAGGGVYYHHMFGYTDAGGVWNCTIVNNTAVNQGGGVHAYDIPGGTIRNCIIYYNTASSNANYGSSVNAYGTCCTTPDTGNTAANNVYVAPQFVASDNYHLRSTSPCIAKGMFKSWMNNAIDADGNPRVINGTVDIGAYEYATEIISASAGAHGTIVPSGDVSVGYGSNVSFSVNAESGCLIASILVDTNPVAFTPASSSFVYVFTNVTTNHTIQAIFNQPPTVALRADPISGQSPLRVQFDFTGSSDPDGSISRYEIDKDGDGIFESQNSSLGKIIVEYGTPGIYQAAGRVIDNYGAASSSASITITVFGTAPIASIQASPTEGTVPLTIQFCGTNSAAIPGHRIVVYEWDFDGNGTYDKISQTGLASWTYSESSTNVVTLRVTDDLGVKGTASTIIYANPNPVPPPVVTLNANPACGDRPLSVVLTALATSERTIASYLWDFNGDGIDDIRTSANSVTNIYSSVGVYQAQVTAVDDLGLSGKGQTNIQVTEPSNLRVWISSPKDGNHVWGTCVSLKGHAVPASRVASFQFQYKLSSTNVWQNLGDIIYPTPHAFSMQWDVTELVDQASYDLRGMATDTSGGTAYSNLITVTVDSGCRHLVGGIVEEISDGIHSKSQTFSKDEEAVLSLFDETTVTVPMGAVEANITVQVRINGTNTNSINGAASGKYCINQNREISIEGNPGLNMPVTIIMPYPDENNDSIVDGTGILETKLSVYWFDLSDGTWKRCLSQEIHTVENYIECSVYHLTEFGIFGSREITTTCDYDGDGKADPAIYTETTGLWQIMLSSQNYRSFEITCGGIGARPVPGDYDGDGKADIAVYYTDDGLWRAKLSGGGYQATETLYGGSGWEAVPGDYDGDGKADIAVYQESSGLWNIALSGSGYQSSEAFLGGMGFIPVANDYDGDGRTDLVVYQRATGYWFGLLSTHGYVPYDETCLGGVGFIPVPADYDRDGKVDPAVYESATGRWLVQLSGSNYAQSETPFGESGFVPLAGDYDGDGKADLVIYHLESGTWFMAFSASSYSVYSMGFGGQGTLPVDAKE